MPKTINEDRHTIPPNFTADDLFYVTNQGAKVVHTKDMSYILYANYAVMKRLNLLWAVESTCK